MTYIEDTSKEIEKIAKRLINTDFPDLSVCKIMYAWNETPKEDTEVMGTTTVFSKKIRDLFELDFLIDINKNYWMNFDNIDKEKVIYDKLSDCVVKKNKDNTIAFDKEDRVKIALKKHDIVLERFQSELDKYGLSYDEQDLYKYLKAKYSDTEKREKQEKKNKVKDKNVNKNKKDKHKHKKHKNKNK